MTLSGENSDRAPYDACKDGTIVVELIPTLPSKTSVAAACGRSRGTPRYAKPEGTGLVSTCCVQYPNTEILGDDGLRAIPHITMGHGLIHGLHALRGQSPFDDKHGEWCTVGIRGCEGEAFCENVLRKKHFRDD